MRYVKSAVLTILVFLFLGSGARVWADYCPGLLENITKLGPLSTATPCGLEDGKRPISIIAQHEQADASPQAQWDFGDGEKGEIFTFAPGLLHEETHRYAPGTYTVLLNIFDCALEPEDIPKRTFTVPSCAICPHITFRDLPGECMESGSQTYVVTAELIGTGSFTAEMTHNETPVDFGTANGSLELSMTKVLTSGSHTIAVNVTDPAFCGGSSLEIVVDCDSDSDFCLTCFCGGIWCCILWLFFMLSIVAMLIAWVLMICGKVGWYGFAVTVGSVIAFAAVLITVCDVKACEFLIGLSLSGFAGWAVVCGTNIIPSNCDNWFCEKTTIPATGGLQVANLLLVDLAFWLIAITICAILS